MLWWVLGVVVAAQVARTALLYRVRPRRHVEGFEGIVYRVGDAAVAERRSDRPRATVICVHGFCEDLRYFTQLYADPEIQLILLTSADYHVPIADPQFRAATWMAPPKRLSGAIEYDAQVLLQALQHLPRTESIRVHGHSRGGAVALEAAAQRPDLFRDVEVILEAPVLPRAAERVPISPVVLWLIPFLFALWRLQPISESRQRWGRLDNVRKREIIEGYPFNARRIVTMMRNLKSMQAWRNRRDFDLYQNVQRGAVLIPDDDQVLDPVSMLDSAKHAAGRLTIVPVQNCSHFVLFDQPTAIPPVRKQVSEISATRPSLSGAT
jgi:pimeloyl-ACP methyl ester carboxylesterase